MSSTLKLFDDTGRGRSDLTVHSCIVACSLFSTSVYTEILPKRRVSEILEKAIVKTGQAAECHAKYESVWGVVDSPGKKNVMCLLPHK